MRPARASIVWITAVACGDSSSSGRLRCDARAEVDLRDGADAESDGDVDQQRDVHAVSLDERQPLEQLAPACVLAGQRLDDRVEVWEQQREQRSGDELGDPSAPCRRRRRGRS